jgi:Family of unknown function (DUF5706)
MTAFPTYPDETTEAKALRRRERALQRAEEHAGPMEPELRFRVLLSILKMETDFLDLADKKARFALVIMSALNAVALVLVMRGGDAIAAADAWGLALRVEVALYFVATVVYIWQAIEALRPRGQRGRLTSELPSEIVPESSMRVLFHSDIAKRDREEFRGLWAHLRLDNVTTELSDQLHMVSRINVMKYRALGRLYVGVGIMTALLTVALLTVGASRM